MGVLGAVFVCRLPGRRTTLARVPGQDNIPPRKEFLKRNAIMASTEPMVTVPTSEEVALYDHEAP